MIKPEYKIIADHLRSSSFLIADGVMPSNEGRGYVLRRIMRRAMLQLHKLNKKEASFYKLFDVLIEDMKTIYPELVRARSLIIDILKNEEIKFKETLDNGLKIVENEVENLKRSNSKILPGDVAFKLYDTYGFPLDLTQNILKEDNILVDIARFDELMNLQKETARKNWVGSGENLQENIIFELNQKFKPTIFCGYDKNINCSKILDIINIGDNKYIILEETCFYATSGGQKGDKGFILKSEDKSIDNLQIVDLDNVSQKVEVLNTIKLGKIHAHLVDKNEFAVGDEVFAIINLEDRQLKAQNHSATHLLHKALKIILGNFVSQKGSNIESEYFTFDFNFNRALKISEIYEIEDLVNYYIRSAKVVSSKVMNIKEANEIGAESLFGEKYEEEVRVISMNPSIELCGGTHVENTGNIGFFKIISESSVASGVRRILAKTGYSAMLETRVNEAELFALNNILRFDNVDDLKFDSIKTHNYTKIGYKEPNIVNNYVQNYEKIEEVKKLFNNYALNLVNQIKQKDKEINNLKKKEIVNDILNSQNNNKFNFVLKIISEIDTKTGTEIVNEVAKTNKYNVIILILVNFSKCTLISYFSENSISSGFNAKEFTDIISKELNIKAGGAKENLAICGGFLEKDIEKINHNLEVYLNR